MFAFLFVENNEWLMFLKSTFLYLHFDENETLYTNIVRLLYEEEYALVFQLKYDKFLKQT